MAEYRPVLHTCELCGEGGMVEDDVRSHMRIVHVEGSPACPFCDLESLTPGELQNHVNSVHLDFLTPEGEHNHYLESGRSEFGSLWELEKFAGERLTEGISSPMESPGEGNPFTESDFESDTEEDTTVRSVVEQNKEADISKRKQKLPHNQHHHQQQQREQQQLSPHSLPGADLPLLPEADSPQKRARPDKSAMTLPLLRRQQQQQQQTGGSVCSSSSASSSSRAPSSPSSSSRAPSSPSSSSLTSSCYPASSPTLSARSSRPSSPAAAASTSSSTANTTTITLTQTAATSSSSCSSLTCPMCPFSHVDPVKLQVHVNRVHLDDLSPAIQTVDESHCCPLCPTSYPSPAMLQRHFAATHSAELSPQPRASSSRRGGEDSNGNTETCPVCGETAWSQQQLQVHVESHFTSPGQPNTRARESSPTSAGNLARGSSPTSAGNLARVSNLDLILAQEMERKEKEMLRWKEQKEFANLQAQYGMDNQGNFAEQSSHGMMKAVVKGEMSVTDFYERQAEMAASSRSGIDDGSSVTERITETLYSLSSKSPGVRVTRVAYRTDHFSSTFGDKGWGCGFRNIQMLLSCLLNTTQYRDSLTEKVTGNANLVGSNIGIPSIPKLQCLIESAWRSGFDRAGCEQLGGKLVNTRKWIGATEVYTFLNYCGLDAQIVDFHRATGEAGTHPLLFQWVWNYFSKQAAVVPPLYLQHQGHSRTICGVEKLNNGSYKLLILDPSHSPTAIRQGPLRLVRKSISGMKSGQYQIVAVAGKLEEREREERRTRPIASTRVPP